MSNKLKALTLGGALAAAASVAVAAPTGVAHAAAYNGVCGSGYSVIDSHGLGSLGTVYLTINSAGRNCVVTIRNNPGAAKHMCAKVSLAGAPWNQDCGNYTTYAGPVYVSAAHQCIDWSGEIDSTVFDERSVHCG
jgi:hypothetical protein